MNQIITGDALIELMALSSKSVDCIVTSPPYYNLRDYGVPGQIGMERTPEEYIERLVTIFRQAYRVLKDSGTLWINIADSYAGSGKGAAKYPENAKKFKQRTNKGSVNAPEISKPKVLNCKPKDLIGIPWMLAFALRSDGWYLRQEIIWSKPNPMPESVNDRCTKSHESIFLFSKSRNYYFNSQAISEPCAESTIKRCSQNINNQNGSDRVPGKTNGNMKAALPRYGGKKYTEYPDNFHRTKSGNLYDFRPFRNKRDVWTVSTKPFKGAHFATFPTDLVEPCILAGSPIGGIVLDCFAGSGTVGEVAMKNDREFILIDLNPQYSNMSKNRLGIQ